MQRDILQSWHLTLVSDGRHVLFPDEAARREAVRRIGAICRAALVLFSLVEDHLHLVVHATRQRKAHLMQALQNSLRAIAAGPLQPTHDKAVAGLRHLEWLLEYLLRQVIRHRVRAHPALWSGSCFQDLAAARWLPGLRLRIWDLLPGFRLRQAHRLVGLPPVPLVPAGSHLIRALGATRLTAAAACAMAADPALPGRRPEVVLARRAVVALGEQAGIPVRELAAALRLTRRTIERQRGRGLPEAALMAVRTRLALEEVVTGLAWEGVAEEMMELPRTR